MVSESQNEHQKSEIHKFMGLTQRPSSIDHRMFDTKREHFSILSFLDTYSLDRRISGSFLQYIQSTHHRNTRSICFQESMNL